MFVLDVVRVYVGWGMDDQFAYMDFGKLAFGFELGSMSYLYVVSKPNPTPLRFVVHAHGGPEREGGDRLGYSPRLVGMGRWFACMILDNHPLMSYFFRLS